MAKVVIIEDESLAADELEAAIKKAGYEVTYIKFLTPTPIKA